MVARERYKCKKVKYGRRRFQCLVPTGVPANNHRILPEQSKVFAASSLWCTYSKLKTILRVREKVDVSSFTNVVSFLKKMSVRHVPRKSNVLSRSQIDEFLLNAPDDVFLLIKVVTAFGVFGAYRRQELHDLCFNDVKVEGSVLVFKVRQRQDFETLVLNEEQNAKGMIDCEGCNRKEGYCIQLAYFPAYCESRNGHSRHSYFEIAAFCLFCSRTGALDLGIAITKSVPVRNMVHSIITVLYTCARLEHSKSASSVKDIMTGRDGILGEGLCHSVSGWLKVKNLRGWSESEFQIRGEIRWKNMASSWHKLQRCNMQVVREPHVAPKLNYTARMYWLEYKTTQANISLRKYTAKGRKQGVTILRGVNSSLKSGSCEKYLCCFTNKHFCRGVFASTGRLYNDQQITYSTQHLEDGVRFYFVVEERTLKAINPEVGTLSEALCLPSPHPPML
ncbi:hypothetical protein C0J52_21891 [Blattella germanica]|nr:hypothetical protein C0J52_21891 [Blattella germanica]